MSYFSEEALQKFNEMCSEGVNFSEGEVYDFARCITAGGEVYGVSRGEKCKIGKPISDKEAFEDKTPAARMAILKRAFIKKTGREMTKEEIAKAAAIVNSIDRRNPKRKKSKKK